MVRYSIYAFCDHGDVHPMGITVSLEVGPLQKQSIGDTYKGKEVPPELTKLHNNSFTCPNTRKLFYQEDNCQLSLVPVEVT